MNCIYCGEKTRTVNSRKRAKGLQIWRRRECQQCKSIFSTNEGVDLNLAVRVKHTTHLEAFSREKLLLELYDSLSHRKTALSEAEALQDTILGHLFPCQKGIIETTLIKEITLKTLKRFDKAAYSYYQAHHP